MRLSVWMTQREYQLLTDVLETTIADNDVDRAATAEKLLSRIEAARHASGHKKRT